MVKIASDLGGLQADKMGAGCGNSLARTVQFCGRWRVKVNSLWMWWYCILTLAAEGYLMYRAVTRCKQYNELPWKTQEKPVLELYVYITLIVISVMCVPFFIITSIFKVGNYANDGTRLGRDSSEVLRPSPEGEGTGGSSPSPGGGGAGDVSRTQVIWRHSGPLCHGFHIVASFCLLLPRILLEAQEIKYGFATPDVIWKSDLDGLFGRSTYQRDDRLDVITTYSMAHNSTGQTLPSGGGLTIFPPTSPEFVNYILALVIYSLRYGAVFWYTKMAFSAIFSLILIISVLHFTFAYNSMGILYKFRVNVHAVEGLHLILPASVVMVLYLLACVVMYTSMIAVFNYGYAHFLEKWKKFLITHFPVLMRRINTTKATGCQGYVPHTIATISLVTVVAFRAPIVYDTVMLYRKTGLDLLLASIIMDAIYMFAWVTLWFMFTVKQTWDFKILLTKTFEQDIAERQPSVYTINNDKNNGTERQPKPKPHHGKHHGKVNGQAVIVSDDPMVASSALRKGKEKREKDSKGVTFDKEVPLKPSDQVEGKVNKSEGKDSDTVLRRTKSDPNRRGESMDDSTLESTLTKSYRHSIRDVCGQYYYRNPLQDQSPPAAQSSPLPKDAPSRRDENGFFPKDEPILHPLQPHRSLPNMNEEFDDQAVRYDRRPPEYTDEAPYRHSVQLPPGYNPHKASREVAMPPPLVDKRRREIMIDHPPAGPRSPRRDPPAPPEYQRLPRDLTGNHQPEAVSKHSGGKPNKRLDFSQPDPRTTDTMSKPQHLGKNPKDSWSYNQPKHKMASKSLTDMSGPADHHDKLSPRATGHGPNSSVNVNTNMYQNLPQSKPPVVPPREGRIVSMKPDLHRRDSALPSSTDTSSNESHENVLCSQV